MDFNWSCPINGKFNAGRKQSGLLWRKKKKKKRVTDFKDKTNHLTQSCKGDFVYDLFPKDFHTLKADFE